MLTIGCHLSSAKGYLAMGKQAEALDANTFQFFTRNPRGSKAKPVNEADLEAYASFARQHAMGPLVAHAPYTLNPASADPGLRDFALRVMSEDLATLEKLPAVYYNFHPGCHVGQGVEAGIEWIAQALNRLLTPGQRTMVLLETMSGKGSEVGASFEELSEIIRRVEHEDKLGVCLDTCHVYSAGYDIRNNLDGVLEQFDRVLGLERLKAVHLNDSMTPFASRKDRHEKIGQGSLGLEAIERIIRHPSLRALPFELETPNELEGYAAEIALLRARAEEEE